MSSYRAALLAVVLLGAADPSAAGVPVNLVVRVNVTFDASIASKDVQAAAASEASALWSKYGVALVWTDTGRVPDVCLDAFVERRNQPVNRDRPLELGRATVGSGAPSPAAPIRLSLDAIDSLVEHLPLAERQQPERAMAMVLGRTLAHEVGHVILGVPSYHDTHGLMRAKIPSLDLARMERARLGLAEPSVIRLRGRIAELSVLPTSGSCYFLAR